VLAILERRVGAKVVAEYLEDLTPRSEYEKAREKSSAPTGLRPKGAGRPTKRDRRVLTSFFGQAD
jgi:ribosome-associated heat shock protein Hsp15